MIAIVQTALLWFAAVGCAAIGGVYFAFSFFIMAALQKAGQEAGMLAMQAINDVILRSLFMPLFFGTTLASAALAGLAIWHWPLPQSKMIFAGSLLFVAGMFLVTIFFNVPLNNKLMAANAARPESAGVWAEYLKTWTMWNSIRTIASIAAAILFIIALIREASA